LLRLALSSITFTGNAGRLSAKIDSGGTALADEDWISDLIEQRKKVRGNQQPRKKPVRHPGGGFQKQIKELWDGVVIELDSTIENFNKLCLPSERVTSRHEGLSYAVRKVEDRSAYGILTVRLDVETSRIQSFGRSSPSYEIKGSASDLYVTDHSGLRIENEELAKEILGEFLIAD
jgi:hypothetical protein